MDIELLQERARIIRQVRAFFDDRNYLELDTPLLSPDLIPESCLEVFETRRISPAGDRHNVAQSPLWLIPSPEIWMKKIIAKVLDENQHPVSVYQICKCFRNGESSGFLHSPEFTMLEYYTMNANYLDSLAITEELFNYLTPRRREFCSDSSRKGAEDAKLSSGGFNPSIENSEILGDKEASAPSSASPRLCVRNSETRCFERITVAQAFAQYAGFDLFEAAERPGALEAEARRLGLAPPAGMKTAELYDVIFIHAVEPCLKHTRPVALLDYPAFVPCLARRSANGTTVERWELYWNGIELANCFSEETDPVRVREFFESEAAAKEHNAVRHNVDHNYWKLFQHGFPACSGVALGLDRLIMALLGRSTIDSVLPFPMG